MLSDVPNDADLKSPMSVEGYVTVVNDIIATAVDATPLFLQRFHVEILKCSAKYCWYLTDNGCTAVGFMGFWKVNDLNDRFFIYNDGLLSMGLEAYIRFVLRKNGDYSHI